MLCTDYSVSILTDSIQLNVDYFLPFLPQIFKRVMKPQLFIVIINQNFDSTVSLSEQPHRASDHCIHVYYCWKLLTTSKRHTWTSACPQSGPKPMWHCPLLNSPFPNIPQDSSTHCFRLLCVFDVRNTQDHSLAWGVIPLHNALQCTPATIGFQN